VFGQGVNGLHLVFEFILQLAVLFREIHMIFGKKVIGFLSLLQSYFEGSLLFGKLVSQLNDRHLFLLELLHVVL
jgi:hypothetical protein